MVINILKCLLLTSLFIFGLSCTDTPSSTTPAEEKVETPSLPIELLTGDWELSSAERNGKITDALEGIYFNFTADQRLISNFNLSTEEYHTSYIVKGKSLITDHEPAQRFLVETLETNKVILLTKMKHFSFRLTLTPREIPVDSLETI